MSEPILRAEHLGITFGGLKAVSDFNMTINSGELIGLIGPNGAGKTTVFNLLTGVYQPTEGEFFLDGERMNGKKTYQVVRAGIARTFQNIRLFGQMTVEENVLVAFNESFSYHMGGAIFRTPKFWKQEREMHAKAIDLLKIFGLEGLAETEAANLPYGAQRKLEIARALATGMKLLLLDEPAAGAIPIGVAHGLDYRIAIAVSILGNLVPVPFIVLFIRKIFAWLRTKSERLNGFVTRMEQRALKKSDTVRRARFWGLFIFVAIPLPGTGAWTGSLIAAMLEMRVKEAFPPIALGVVTAGIIVAVVTYGAASLLF